MPDKLTALRIKQQDGTYSAQIPVGALAENVAYNSSYSVRNVLGNVEMSKGSVQEQLNSFDSKIGTQVSEWLEENVQMASGVDIDQTLTVAGQAADAQAAGKLLTVDNESTVSATKFKVTTTTQTYNLLTDEDIDTTLTQSGAAADAKVTGDEITNIKSALNDYIEPFTDSTMMLTDKWIIGSIDTNGNIQKYAKRICTPYYLRSSYDVTIINANPATSVSRLRIISVLYNADFTLISRTINGFGKNVTIPANTYFRICVINKNDDQNVDDVYDIAKYVRVSNDIYKSILNTQNEAERLVSAFEMNESIRLLSEYKLGGLDSNGEVIDKNSRVVFVDYLIYDKTTQLYLEYSYSAVICLYNNDKTLLSRTTYTDGFTKVITIPANTYFRVCIWNLVETAITDIEDIVTHIYIWNPYTELYTDSEAIAILESFAVIGDSLSAGYVGSSNGNYGSEVAKAANRNWPSYLSNRINRPFTNLSKGSSSAHDWRYGNSSLGVDINTADIDTYCYMIAIGVNDARQNNPIGTINDIAENYENNADTFYGNYDYIIRKLKTFADNRISQVTTFVFTIPPTEPNAELYNEAIRAIAIKNWRLRVNLIDISRLFYDSFLTPPFSNTWVSGHSRPLGYMMLSNMIRIAINKYMMENPSKFVWTPWPPIS